MSRSWQPYVIVNLEAEIKIVGRGQHGFGRVLVNVVEGVQE